MCCLGQVHFITSGLLFRTRAGAVLKTTNTGIRPWKHSVLTLFTYSVLLLGSVSPSSSSRFSRSCLYLAKTSHSGFATGNANDRADIIVRSGL